MVSSIRFDICCNQRYHLPCIYRCLTKRMTLQAHPISAVYFPSRSMLILETSHD
ncbi:hypothetical protein SETIT_8G029300v2 [Setaria italica]|uniref:Uncharacterized protein n=1 Tax=Setaria italica TaxID=4555 RepID=A0A368S3I2_SETIT|nr:hypothetical protein SETIT_8G029300v2 [Setaria italica]